MKRKITLLLILAFFAFEKANAQLSGAYTVGGTSPDYVTVTDALTALTTQGVSASVIFNIRPGTYAGKLSFETITGASATNTVTFQSENGDSTSVIITSPSSVSSVTNYTVLLDSTDYVTFSKLTLERTGGNAYAHVIEITGGCDYNFISNCVIKNGVTTGTSANSALVFSISGSVDNYNTFSNNRLENGTIGFTLFGGGTGFYENGTQLINNVITGQSNIGIQAGNQNDIVISGNIINASVVNYGWGIYASTCTNNSAVYLNKIDLTGGGTGVWLQQCSGGANEVRLYNNFVSVGGSGAAQAYGIRLFGCTNTGVYYNSVNNTSTSAANNFAFYSSQTSSGVTVKNNIFFATAGYAATILNSSVATMDNNDLFVTGFNFGQYNTINYTNLASWQAATSFDLNSVNLDPVYLSASDLHVTAFGLNTKATPIGGITTDIDGTLRDGTTPDIGADEYTPPADDAGVVAIISPTNNACGSSIMNIKVAVRNYAAEPKQNVSVTVEVTGLATSTQTASLPGTLDIGDTDTLIFPLTINTSAGGSVTTKAYTSLPGDLDFSNDTMTTSANIQTIPAAPVVPGTQVICSGDTSTINATFGSSLEVFWFNALSGGSLIGVGNPLQVTPTSTTTYYAETRDASTSIGCLRITECELNDASVSGGDYIEIQNLSPDTIDATGWVVAVSDNYANINAVNATLWNLGIIAPGETQIRCDGCANFPWGQNLLWNGGAFPAFTGWVMIVDNIGQVVDFVAWEWPDADIQAMNVVVNGFNVTPVGKWTGNGTVGCTTGSVSRIGSIDNDNATDWSCDTQTENATNATLSVPMLSCGFGSCPSDRVPVTVQVGSSLIFLGNDTTIPNGGSITLDPGNIGATYQWSTGATTQSIVINSAGSYTVTVTDISGCSGSDAINVSIAAGLDWLGTDAQIIVSPNPAKENVNINILNVRSANYSFRLMDIAGHIILLQNAAISNGQYQLTLDLSPLSNGIYFVEISSAEGSTRRKLIKQ